MQRRVDMDRLRNRIKRWFGLKPRATYLPDGSVFSYQYWLWEGSRFTVILSNILLPDPPDLSHDHSGWFISAVLLGGYTENLHTPRGGVKVVRGPGDIALRTHRDIHRIVAVLPGTWTLRLSGMDAYDDAVYYVVEEPQGL